MGVDLQRRVVVKVFSVQVVRCAQGPCLPGFVPLVGRVCGKRSRPSGIMDIPAQAKAGGGVAVRQPAA